MTNPITGWTSRARRLARAFVVLVPLAAAQADPGPGAVATWRIDGGVQVGDAKVQASADGTLSGSLFGEPLTGFRSPGERLGVWLRGEPSRPSQAFVGTVTPDGNGVAGRWYALDAGAGGASQERNVFAFTAVREGARPPRDKPAPPADSAGPAVVAGTLALTANGMPGEIVLEQAADGSLVGKILGDRLAGHYAPGSGTVVFLRYEGSRPVQLYTGSVTPRGITGEFYALTARAGGSERRMRYAWSAQPSALAATRADTGRALVERPPSGGAAQPVAQTVPPAATQAMPLLPQPATAQAMPTLPQPALQQPAAAAAMPALPQPAAGQAVLPGPGGPAAKLPTLPGVGVAAGTPPPALLGRPALPPVRPGPELACGIAFANPCAEALNPVSVQVRWAARAEATGYRVYRDGQLVAALDGSARAHVDGDARTGAVSRYRVEAVRSTGSRTIPLGTPATRADRVPEAQPQAGGPVVTIPTGTVLEVSQERSVAVPAVDAVRDLQGRLASAEQGRVRLTWTPSRHASGHLVLRNGAPLAEVGAVGAFEDTGTAPGAQRYTVRPFFRPGPGRGDLAAAPSNEALVNVPAPSPMLVGTGISDITGPVAEVGMMGYASAEQSATGLHMRLYSRAFVFASPAGDRRVVFVTADLGQLFSSVKQGVIRRLQQRHGALYDDRNVMIAATHTHAGPGGYAHHALFNLSTFGHNRQNYDAIVDGIVESIQRAHDSLAPGEVSHVEGRIDQHAEDREHANIQRSGDAFRRNLDAAGVPDRNPSMDVLRITRGGRPIGAVTWYASHNNLLTKHNTLVCSDHKGLAAYQFEKQMGSVMPLRNPGAFVAAFPNSDEGDMSANTWADWGSRAHTDAQFIRMQIVARRQYTAARALYAAGGHRTLRPDIDFRHTFVDMPGFTVRAPSPGSRGNQLCNAAYGFSFGAGAEDGRSGAPILEEGMTETSPLTAAARASLYAIGAAIVPPQLLQSYTLAMGASALAADNACHFPKPVLIPSGSLGWTARILPFQLFRIDSLAIVAVPGEMTVQAGRRLRSTVEAQLRPLGVQRVIITGLANEYTGYITTPEEYDAQHYEGASTVFGRLTFDAYRQVFGDMAGAMAAGQPVPAGPTPPDLSGGPVGTGNIELQTGVVYDDKRVWESFGQVLREPTRTGAQFSAVFRAGHPKNDLRRNASYFLVERQVGNGWEVVATDADPQTRMVWRRDEALDCRACSTIEVQWDVVPDPDTRQAPPPGTYRIRLFGAWKQGPIAPVGTGRPIGSVNAYEGVTRPFRVE